MGDISILTMFPKSDKKPRPQEKKKKKKKGKNPLQLENGEMGQEEMDEYYKKHVLENPEPIERDEMDERDETDKYLDDALDLEDEDEFERNNVKKPTRRDRAKAGRTQPLEATAQVTNGVDEYYKKDALVNSKPTEMDEYPDNTLDLEDEDEPERNNTRKSTKRDRAKTKRKKTRPPGETTQDVRAPSTNGMESSVTNAIQSATNDMDGDKEGTDLKSHISFLSLVRQRDVQMIEKYKAIRISVMKNTQRHLVQMVQTMFMRATWSGLQLADEFDIDELSMYLSIRHVFMTALVVICAYEGTPFHDINDNVNIISLMHTHFKTPPPKDPDTHQIIMERFNSEIRQKLWERIALIRMQS